MANSSAENHAPEKSPNPSNKEIESLVNNVPRQDQKDAGDPHCKSLYIGNLDPRVNDQILGQIFQSVAEVCGVKICRDRNAGPGSLNYGFVDFANHEAAEAALQTLNGRKIFSSEIKVNWAFAGSRDSNMHSAGRPNGDGQPAGELYSIFVGDLAPDITDAALVKTFSTFWSMCDARVMWDTSTGKSRGYGFVTFKDKLDAESAINTMNGAMLGSRSLRINWASSKPQAQPLPDSKVEPAGAGAPKYEIVLAQAAPYNCTVYVGNLPPQASQNDLHPLFSQFGYVTEIRLQIEKGYAFVKFDSHESAARAIVGLHSQVLGGRTVKCNWGKDRPPAQYGYAGAPAMHMGAPGHPPSQIAYGALSYGANHAAYSNVPLQFSHAASVPASSADAASLPRAGGMQPYDANMYFYYMQQQQQQSQQPMQGSPSQLGSQIVAGAGVQGADAQNGQFKMGPMSSNGAYPAHNFQQYYHQYWENYYQQQAQQMQSQTPPSGNIRNSS